MVIRPDTLRAAHAVHPHPEAVVDALFAGGRPFVDARDLVQVKYEMLRDRGLPGSGEPARRWR